jgi:hypothetical protein
MASILEEIGRHPFVTARQLERIVGASRSGVADRLSRLKQEGFAENVTPRSAVIGRQKLWYLTPSGARHLGLPRRPGRPRFVERMDTVFEVRNFLISAQRAGIPFAEWQVLPAAVEGVSAHAAARTFREQMVIIEWDRGGRPLKLYRTRARSLVRLANKAGAGLLIVAADQARGTGILTVVGRQMGIRGPLAGLTSRQMIAARGVGDALSFVPAIREAVSIGGFVSSLPPRTEVSVQVIRPGISSFGGGWTGNAALVLELHPQQKQVLSILTSLPLVTVDDLAVIAGSKSRRWVQQNLWKLERAGLVTHYVDDERYLIRHYHATSGGVEFMASTSGSPLKSYARARGIVLTPEGEVSVRYLTRVFDHTVQTRQMVMAFAREAASRGTTAEWVDEHEAQVWFSLGGEPQLLAPDARVHLGEATIYLEVDRATSAVDKLQDKLHTYYRFWRSAEHRRFGASFVVVVVAPEPRREAVWLRETALLSKGYGGKPLPIVTAVHGDVMKEGIGGKIFRSLGNGTKRKTLETLVQSSS